MTNKTITMILLSLVLLSLYSSFAVACRDNLKPVAQPETSTLQESSESHSREYRFSVNSCIDANLRRGDSAIITLHGKEYTIKQGLTGERYVQLDVAGIQDRFYLNDYVRYDLDNDGQEDLQVSLYEIATPKAHIVICGLEQKPATEVAVSEVAQEQTLSFYDRIKSWFN